MKEECKTWEGRQNEGAPFDCLICDKLIESGETHGTQHCIEFLNQGWLDTIKDRNEKSALLDSVSRNARDTEERLRQQGDVIARKLQAAELQVRDLTKNLETVTQQREAMRTEVQVYQLEVERLKEDVTHWEKQFGHASEHVDELEAKLTGEKDLCIRAIECSSRIGRAMEDCLAAMGRAYDKLEWMKGEDVVDCKSQIKAAGERGRVALRGTVSRDTEKRPCPKCGFWNCEESCLAPGRAAEAKGAENRIEACVHPDHFQSDQPCPGCTEKRIDVCTCGVDVIRKYGHKISCNDFRT